MRALVTGVAGFIGSHVAEALLERGDEVVGIDAFTSYYNLGQKRFNIERLRTHRDFRLIEVDLRTAPLQEYVDGCDVVLHQAAQPGVRASWGAFASYVEHNVLATQRILEASRSAQVRRFVYASSSSVYGNAPTYPTTENEVPRPHSPYGVTKLSAEHLVRLYGENWSLPTIGLRYFTVYGPGQRPDMAMHRLIDSAFYGRRFSLFGDGSQIRDFTYVGDVVEANMAAVDSQIEPGTIVNIAGGGSMDMITLVRTVEKLTGNVVQVERLPAKPGDVEQTGGDISAAMKALDWRPVVDIETGLTHQIEWQRSLANASSTSSFQYV